jgi:hypothetical protein
LINPLKEEASFDKNKDGGIEKNQSLIAPSRFVHCLFGLLLFKSQNEKSGG